MDEEGEKEGSSDKSKHLPGNKQTKKATKDDNVNQTLSTIRIKKTGRRRTSKFENIPEHHRFFPIACVAQLMRNALPPSAKVTQDAKECVQEIASEFILFISSEASDCCRADGRDVITYEDILEAMQALGFDNYVEPLSIYMKKYREAFPGKNKSLRLANFVPHLHNPNVNDSSGSTKQNNNFARKLVPLAPKTAALDDDTDLSNSVPEVPQNIHFMDTTTGQQPFQMPSPGETSQLIPIRPSVVIDSITNGQNQEAGEFTSQNGDCAPDSSPLAPKSTALAGDIDLSNSVPEKLQNVHFMDTTTGEHSSQLPSPGETSQLIPIRPSTVIDSIINGQNQEAGESISQDGDCAPDSSPLAPKSTALAGDIDLSNSVPEKPQNVHFMDTTTGEHSSQLPSP
ncbi:unnamed protein product, partial [Gongylonema pulchrum]|uniref:CBFD_NFYB_HMF domain-containing protein n=1 Tax=Gongylonema pulchrum TaxID=637853 RepID=A0A183DJ24_9BILA